MSIVKEMIESGIHFGHRASAWNPKMGNYIYGKKNGIHIIDLRETVKGLLLAKKFLTQTVSSGKDVLFVGTKRQARPSVSSVIETAGMPYVTERWLGGTLTNFRTIRSRLTRLEELEALMDSPDWINYSKKMASQLTRERRKITRNLGGIRTMDRLPGAVVVIDVSREQNALKEATHLGIPTICLIDTDSNPDMADIPIPGNDDAMRAIELVINQLVEAVNEGKTARAQASEGRDAGSSDAPKTKRRSSRSQFRAEEKTATAPVTETPAATPAPVATEPAPAAPVTEQAPAVESVAAPVEAAPVQTEAPEAPQAELPTASEVFEKANETDDENKNKPAE